MSSKSHGFRKRESQSQTQMHGISFNSIQFTTDHQQYHQTTLLQNGYKICNGLKYELFTIQFRFLDNELTGVQRKRKETFIKHKMHQKENDV